MSDFTPFLEKMRAANVNEAAIRSFERNYQSLSANISGLISENDISPVAELPLLEDISESNQTFCADLLAQTVIIKLNGGLGTSMGLQKAKSLLPVRGHNTFLDIIVEQIKHLRQSTGADIKFLLMNSFSTSEDTLAHLQQYAENQLANAEDVEMLQNQVPKIDQQTLAPATFNENPELEWCPPGHGDLYAAITGSGWLDKLLSQGIKYAFVSNSDNLGAVLDAGILEYFAKSGIPFMMEATTRTEADKKGGHLAIRNADQQMLLREVAQCPDEDIPHFQDTQRHRFFNTNNLWIQLEHLKAALTKNGGSLPLPMIKNSKTIDPRDKASTPVFQLETAMGAAIECFANSGAICVPRSRFAPVKTSADLFALRTDAYHTTSDGRIALIPERNGTPPTISLSDEYKLVDSLEGLGIPSLKDAASLTIRGPVRFSENVIIRGDVTFTNEDRDTKWIASGTYQNEEVTL